MNPMLLRDGALNLGKQRGDTPGLTTEVKQLAEGLIEHTSRLPPELWKVFQATFAELNSVSSAVSAAVAASKMRIQDARMNMGGGKRRDRGASAAASSGGSGGGGGGDGAGEAAAAAAPTVASAAAEAAAPDAVPGAADAPAEAAAPADASDGSEAFAASNPLSRRRRSAAAADSEEGETPKD